MPTRLFCHRDNLEVSSDHVALNSAFILDSSPRPSVAACLRASPTPRIAAAAALGRPPVLGRGEL